MSQKRKLSPSRGLDSEIFESTPITDRSSKFIAFFSPSVSAPNLQSQPCLSTATHKIAAWRQPSLQRSLNGPALLQTDHDDDGEKYGGKTLEKVLSSANVEGVIVVARWYGGVMLGPVRFDHIRNCALEAIASWKDSVSKKRKIQEEADIRKRLLQELPERDHSITVLRELLAEKTKASPSGPSTKASPAKVPNYETLPLPALKKLERVRDATIEWILKEIERAENPQRRSNGGNSVARDNDEDG